METEMIKLNFTDRLTNFTIEELIEYLSSNYYEKEIIDKKITESNLTITEQEKLLNKITRAYHRIKEPLELDLVLFYVFFPLGYVNSFSETEDENFKRFKKFRYLRKIKEYYIFSVIGIIIYSLIIPLLFILIA